MDDFKPLSPEQIASLTAKTAPAPADDFTPIAPGTFSDYVAKGIVTIAKHPDWKSEMAQAALPVAVDVGTNVALGAVAPELEIPALLARFPGLRAVSSAGLRRLASALMGGGTQAAVDMANGKPVKEALKQGALYTGTSMAAPMGAAALPEAPAVGGVIGQELAHQASSVANTGKMDTSLTGNIIPIVTGAAVGKLEGATKPLNTPGVEALYEKPGSERFKALMDLAKTPGARQEIEAALSDMTSGAENIAKQNIGVSPTADKINGWSAPKIMSMRQKAANAALEIAPADEASKDLKKAYESIANAGNYDDLTQIARNNYLSKGHPDILKEVKRTLGPEDWSEYANANLSHYLYDPTSGKIDIKRMLSMSEIPEETFRVLTSGMDKGAASKLSLIRSMGDRVSKAREAIALTQKPQSALGEGIDKGASALLGSGLGYLKAGPVGSAAGGAIGWGLNKAGSWVMDQSRIVLAKALLNNSAYLQKTLDALIPVALQAESAVKRYKKGMSQKILDNPGNVIMNIRDMGGK